MFVLTQCWFCAGLNVVDLAGQEVCRVCGVQAWKDRAPVGVEQERIQASLMPVFGSFPDHRVDGVAECYEPVRPVPVDDGVGDTLTSSVSGGLVAGSDGVGCGWVLETEFGDRIVLPAERVYVGVCPVAAAGWVPVSVADGSGSVAGTHAKLWLTGEGWRVQPVAASRVFVFDGVRWHQAGAGEGLPVHEWVTFHRLRCRLDALE